MEVIKVLGQAAPLAAVETALYTVPAATSAVVSTVTICNRAAGPTTFRVSIRVGGGVTANKDYIYYAQNLAGNTTFSATIGITLAAADVVRVYAGSANLSFNLFGVERT